jgi:poly(hydroxyalkanoate) granule-associated protein
MKKNIQHADGTLPVIRESVEQIWLAGLGALVLAENEGGKLFKTLVKKGEVAQKSTMGKTKSLVEEQIEDMKEMTTDRLAKIGDAFDHQVAVALGRIGVPTKKEIATLTKSVEGLRKTVENQQQARTRKATPRKNTALRVPVVTM